MKLAPVRHTQEGMHSGLAMLVMLMMVLSLSAFGLAALSTAKADAVLTEKAMAHTADIYAVQSQAEEYIADIDGSLSDYTGTENIYTMLRWKIPGLSLEGNTLNFVLPVGSSSNSKSKGTQKLSVTVEIITPDTPEEEFTGGFWGQSSRCRWQYQLINS